MLHIKMDSGSWKRLEPEAVVEGIFDGSLDHSTLARDDTEGAQSTLSHVLGMVHFRLLSQRLLDEVGLFYCEARSARKEELVDEKKREGLGLAQLRQRVAELAEQWDFRSTDGQRMHLRLVWLSAWLAELQERYDEAINRYSAFLALKPGRDEPGLTLLARNNSAVLKLRQGKLSALLPLAWIALLEYLPGACFSLLNTLNLVCNQNLLPVVDAIMMRVLSKLDPDNRAYWIGPDPPAPPKLDPPTSTLAPGEEPPPTEEEPPRRSLCSEPHALERLGQMLLYHALPIRPFGDDEARSLQLWSQPRELVIKGLVGTPPLRHADYAEAVALLYPRDVPTNLSIPAAPASRDEALAEKQLSEARKLLDANKLDAAQAMVLDAQMLVSGQTRPGPRTKRIVRVSKRLLQTINVRQHELRAAGFDDQLSELSREVREICQVQELSEAQQRRFQLTRQFEDIEELQRTLWNGKGVNLTATLRSLLDEHITQLQDQLLQRNLATPYKRLIELMPKDLQAPVASEAHQALELCRSVDPEGRTHNWDDVRQLFEQHDARHYFHRAFQHACDCRNRDTEETKKLLVKALALEAGLAPYAAPLIALLHLPQDGGKLESFTEIRDQLIQQAKTLIEDPVLGGDPLVRPALRREVVSEAVSSLRRVTEVLLTRKEDEDKVRNLTKSLWQVLQPVVRRGTPEDIDVVAEILHRWRTVCEDWFVPDHPIHLAEHDILASKQLAAARACLQQGKTEAARPFAEQALQLGLTDEEQALTAVQYYALARPLEGPPKRQQKTIKGLKDRVKALNEEARNRLSVTWIEKAIAEIEASLDGQESQPPGPASFAS